MIFFLNQGTVVIDGWVYVRDYGMNVPVQAQWWFEP